MIKRTLVFGNSARLFLRNGQLVVERDGDGADKPQTTLRPQPTTIPVEDIGLVVLEDQQITITHGLLAALLDNNAAVVTCDRRRMPCGLLLPLEGNTIQSERFQAQLEASVPQRKQLWQQTVSAKIQNQGLLLASLGRTADCMFQWARQVKSGDSDNLEGRAAAYYWKTLFADVEGFKRGREEAYPNNLLNYGYAILRAVVARSLVASGLLPVMGIHHRSRYNAYCLADDVMEPYRPFVDNVVVKTMCLFPGIDELNKEVKKELLGIPVCDVVIGGARSPLMVGTTQTTASLAKCFLGELRKVSYPVFDA
ncbi:MAG: type II CRISPR-associated endonuclease Cas1 [Bacteroidales bacterium]|nr:type II CRISPR-associated endonuclease Cas1 [Bacteroidales bacterium]